LRRDTVVSLDEKRIARPHFDDDAISPKTDGGVLVMESDKRDFIRDRFADGLIELFERDFVGTR
jgi:hypothetical protein